MATQFGLAANHGIPAAETGIILDSISYNYAQESSAIRNIGGDTVGKTYFDERMEFSMSGFIPVTSGFSTTLASTITLITAPTDYFKGTVGGLTIVESVNRSHSVGEYQRIEISAMHHPLMA
jgi:hypothetical protein